MQSVHENRIYSLKMHCGDQYPDKPPTIQFINQVNLPCVNARNGVVCHLSPSHRPPKTISSPPQISPPNQANILSPQVDPTKLPCLSNWSRDNTMETVLIELRRYMAHPTNKKLPQPAEGSTYS